MKLLKIIAISLFSLIFLFVGIYLANIHLKMKDGHIPDISPRAFEQDISENNCIFEDNNIAYEHDNQVNKNKHDNDEINLDYNKIKFPPIPLDREIHKHLEAFHEEAINLNKEFPNSYYLSLPSEEKKIALTFDDGPEPYSTTKILEILNSKNIKATFFVIGENVNKHPEIIEQIIESEHQVSNHSHTHPRPMEISTEALYNDVIMSMDILNNYQNTQPKYFRPPYGLLKNDQMNMLYNQGYVALAWSIDSMDWYTSDPDKIARCVIEPIHPSAIILMHDGGSKDMRAATIKALPTIIDSLLELKYEFVTIDQMIK